MNAGYSKHLRSAADAGRANGRWTPQRKAALIALVDAGEVTLDQAAQDFGFTAEELDEWRRRQVAFGRAGLKVTSLQMCGHA